MFQAHHTGRPQQSRHSQKLVIGKDLENLLTCFALRHGAAQAHVDQTRHGAFLVSTTRSGITIRTELTGSAAEWYAALGADDLDVENDRAGLLRFLGDRSEHQNNRMPVAAHNLVASGPARRRQLGAHSTVQSAAHASLSGLASKHSSPLAARA